MSYTDHTRIEKLRLINVKDIFDDNNGKILFKLKHDQFMDAFSGRSSNMYYILYHIVLFSVKRLPECLLDLLNSNMLTEELRLFILTY